MGLLLVLPSAAARLNLLQYEPRKAVLLSRTRALLTRHPGREPLGERSGICRVIRFGTEIPAYAGMTNYLTYTRMTVFPSLRGAKRRGNPGCAGVEKGKKVGWISAPRRVIHRGGGLTAAVDYARWRSLIHPTVVIRFLQQSVGMHSIIKYGRVTSRIRDETSRHRRFSGFVGRFRAIAERARAIVVAVVVPIQ